MAGSNTVIFVHGMGEAVPGFSDGAWASLQKTYTRLRPGRTLDADRKEFLYNWAFKEYRQAPQQALAEIATVTGDAGINAFIKELSQSGQFVHTHVLDVLLWRFHAHVRSVITTDLAAKLMPYLKTLASDAEANLVIVPFSLGTAVMNDVIHFTASMGVTQHIAIPAIHMLANVSKVLERPELRAYHPSAPSLCRPDTGSPADRRAALQHYFTYWNRLDPIPQVDRFKPSWPDTVYHDTAFTALNPGVLPHDLNLYVQAPEVYVRLLRSITLDAAFTKELETKEIYGTAPAPPAPAGAVRRAVLERVLGNFEQAASIEHLLKLLRILKDIHLI